MKNIIQSLTWLFRVIIDFMHPPPVDSQKLTGNYSEPGPMIVPKTKIQPKDIKNIKVAIKDAPEKDIWKREFRGDSRYMWCLDAGHTQKQAGKRSPKWQKDGTGQQFFEWEFNRDIVNRIAKKLYSEGISYFIVVPENIPYDIDNKGNYLSGRVRRANELEHDNKIFVSVHANAAPAKPGKWCDPSISGVECFYSKEDEGFGKKLANTFQKHIIAQTGWKHRRVVGEDFYVLRKTAMAAILTENGFYNNKDQCLELMKPEVRQKIADAHVFAILEMEEMGLKK